MAKLQTWQHWRPMKCIKRCHVLCVCVEYIEQIKSGEEEFESLASQFSDCSSARNGGDLGIFGRGEDRDEPLIYSYSQRMRLSASSADSLVSFSLTCIHCVCVYQVKCRSPLKTSRSRWRSETWAAPCSPSLEFTSSWEPDNHSLSVMPSFIHPQITHTHTSIRRFLILICFPEKPRLACQSCTLNPSGVSVILHVTVAFWQARIPHLHPTAKRSRGLPSCSGAGDQLLWWTVDDRMSKQWPIKLTMSLKKMLLFYFKAWKWSFHKSEVHELMKSK